MYFRAFYAIRPLSNKAGMPTNALYGFLSMSLKLLRETKPDYVAYCFDTPAPSFRKQIYADYKANRTEMPEDLVPQVPYVRQISEALGIPCFELPGWEADDLIGTFTKRGREAKLDVVIVSGDKDFAQLIDPHVQMLDTMKDVRIDVNAAIEKWGVRPDQMQDYLSLIGDSSDNIPGVDGIGPKGAQKLLSEFDTLEAIFGRLDEVKNPGLKKKLEAGRESALLSKRLVCIETDAPVKTEIGDFRPKAVDAEKMNALLETLNFASFAPKIFGANSVQPMPSPALANASASTDSKPLTKEKPAAAPSKPEEEAEATTAGGMQLGFFSEQSSVDAGSSTQLAHGLPFETWINGLAKGSQIQLIWTGREMILSSEKGYHNAGSDPRSIAGRLAEAEVQLAGFDLKEGLHRLHWPIEQEPDCVWDSMLAAYCLRPGRKMEIEDIQTEVLGSSLPVGASAEDWIQADRELEKRLAAQLKEAKLEEVYRNMDLPLISVLHRMETIGIKVDPSNLRRQSEELGRDLKALEKSIYEQAGEEFLISSTKQLAVILFEKLKMPHGRKTKSGFSTDHDVLAKLGKEHKIARDLIEHRELAKLRSTYTEALLNLIDPNDGRIHSRFNAAVASTGRLSSTNPNLQNIPVRTERGRAVRTAFVAPKGSSLISADYSQIELRILAHFSEDPGLIRAFDEDLDIHLATASEIFGLKLSDVTPDHRRIAKAVNFGLAYGMTAFGLAENLEIPREEASALVKSYFSKFGRVRDYMTHTVEFAKSHGFVETLFGRRRYLPEINDSRQQLRNFAERAAINAPIQGTAADLVKMAMIKTKSLESAILLLQVHDELVFECPTSLVPEVSKKIENLMETIHPLRVRLKVNLGSADNWESAH